MYRERARENYICIYIYIYMYIHTCIHGIGALRRAPPAPRRGEGPGAERLEPLLRIYVCNVP